MTTRARAPRWLTSAFAVVVAGTVGLGVLPPTAASADSAPVAPTDPSSPTTVSSDPLPTPQIGSGVRPASNTDGVNDTEGAGVVWDQAVVGNTVYVGGSFLKARPSGAAPGEKVVDRSNFLAYNLETGALLPLSISFDQQIKSLAVSPDQKTLYAAGSFSKVNGKDRYRVVAIDVATGTVIESFKPFLDSRVSDVAVTGNAVYLAGAFRAVNKEQRVSFAAVAPGTGATLPWAPRAEAGGETTKVDGKSVIASPSGDKVIVAGNFFSMNGSTNPGRGMAALHPVTAELLPWKVNAAVRNAANNTGVTDLTTDGSSVYGTAFQAITASRPHGPENFLEGTFKASWADGAIQWLADCHGDTYSAAPLNGVVYTAGHAHYCKGVGGFGDGAESVTSNNYHRALAFSSATTRTLTPWTLDGTYTNFGGQPSPSLLDWYPDFATGKFTASDQAAWDVTTAGKYVLYGGEFPSVNQKPQQGLVRFAIPAAAPNVDGPQLAGDAMKPTASAVTGGTVRLSWPANYDRDNASLAYEVIRTAGTTTTTVGSVSAQSRFWNRPTLTFTDTAAPAGATVQYRIKSIDPFKNSTTGSPVSIAVPTGSPTAAYDQAVLKDSPTAYWPLNEPTGTKGADLVGTDPQLLTGASRDVAGPISGAKASQFGGTIASYSSSQVRKPAPDRYSSELWFSTTSKQGGKLFGFADGTAPDSPGTERHVYLDDTGRLTYGVTDTRGAGGIVTTQPGYNDGKWHHVVTTLGAKGQNLYIDGKKVASNPTILATVPYTGFWNIGGHVSSWPGRGTSNFIAGSISNVAVYDGELSEQSIEAHRNAMIPAAPQNVAPTASFTAAPKDLTVALDASASTDTDGSIASYAWSFGDGTTASGKTTSKVYAKAGSYTVTLTTTDNAGAKTSSSKTVAVVAPAAPVAGVLAADGFARAASSAWGTAPTGGAWAISGGNSGFSVVSPTGRMTNTPGQTRTATLPAVSTTASDSVVSFTIDSTVTVGHFVSVIGRSVGSESYSARVYTHSGGVQLQILRGETTLKAVNLTGLAYTKGDTINVRFQAIGSGTTTLNAKAWTKTAEPTAWQLSTTDTTPTLQKAGSVGLRQYVSASGAATTVAFSGYTVKAG
jgi:PKD repeat protein